MRGFRDGGSLGAAGGLEGFEVLHAAFDGALDGGFVADEAGEVVGALALFHESAGEEIFRFVGIGRVGVFPVAVHVEFVIRLPFSVEADQNGGFFAVDAGFEGKGAVEAPLGGGDALDDQFFAVADGAEVVVEILEEAEEGFGILAFEDEVFVAGEAVGEAVAAGGGFAFGGAGAGGFLGVAAVGIRLPLGNFPIFISVHRFAGAGAPSLSTTG